MPRGARFLLADGAASLLAAVLRAAAWCQGSAPFGPVVTRAPGTGERSRIALTFDDGPDPEVTPQVLEALAAEGARASFFLIGERARAHPDLVARIAAEGHSIGNHSLTHAAPGFRSGAAIEHELAATQRVLAGAGGVEPRWFRPPHGLRDPRLLGAARRLGLTTVLWSASSRDWRDADPGRIAARVLAHASDGAIVLLHDGDAHARRGRPQSARALPALLRDLRARGFELVGLDQLLASRGPR